MPKSTQKIDVYLEVGSKKTFAGAIDWPGWIRAGRDEETALQALLDYGPRYAKVVKEKGVDFHTPEDVSTFHIVERLEGNSTTDFGAPAVAPSGDSHPIDDAELARLQTLLKACWQAFDHAAQAAGGKELRKGPRGGGRELEGITQHVLGAEAGYINSLAWKYKLDEAKDLSAQATQTRQAALDALAAAARGELPERGPRGGVIWKPRYFVRRDAWHVLDHAWEIEDRVT